MRVFYCVPRHLADQIVDFAFWKGAIVFSLFGGAFADTYNRRAILFITQSLMTLTAAALAWLTFMGQIQIWHIWLITAIQAAAIAFDGHEPQPTVSPAD